MHSIQQKILKLSAKQNLAGLSLRKIGEEIGELGSPQKIKHHLHKLMEKGLLLSSVDGRQIKKISVGLDKKSNLVSLPIYGTANCGQALKFADDQIEGYLQLSKKILGTKLSGKINNLYVLKTVGSSMNQANINGQTIEHGDYVVIDKSQIVPKDGQYVVSIINSAANIKKIFIDQQNRQVVLCSETTENLTPIYIHQDDIGDYIFSGTVVRVLKQPDELQSFRRTAMSDTLKHLGAMPAAEYNYYKSL